MLCFDKVKFAVTNDCHGRCAFCRRAAESKSLYLPMHVLQNAVAAARDAGVGSFHVSGGDPALHPCFDQIMALLLEAGPRVKLSINAISIPTDQLHHFFQNGLHELALSIASVDAARHDGARGIPGEHAQLISVLRKFGTGLGRITLTFIITHTTAHEVPRLRTMLEMGPSIRLKLHLVDPSLSPSTTIASQFDPKNDVIQRLYMQDVPALRNMFGPNRVVIIPTSEHYSRQRTDLDGRTDRSWMGARGEDTIPCRYMLKNPHIGEDGRVHACCGRSEDRLVGDLQHESLLPMYHRLQSRQWPSRGLAFPSCGTCIFYSYYGFSNTEK